MLHRLSCSVFALLLWSGSLSAAGKADYRVAPAKLQLTGPRDQQQLLISRRDGRRWVDRTRDAKLSVENPKIATVDEKGRVRALAEGATELIVVDGNQKLSVPVEVTGIKQPRKVSFELDVQPVLGANGCNAGACHGKSKGQNGFQLSLLAFDPEFDFAALTREGRGRRVSPATPERSLLLRKATAQVPHGGGRRLDAGGVEYQTVAQWVREGLARRVVDEPKLDSISIFPPQRVMRPNERQQLRVIAKYSDQSIRDVTTQTTFQSNESAIVGVNGEGIVAAGKIPGESTIMARYMGQITTCHVIIPLPGTVPDELYKSLPRNNFIDELVWAKLKQLGITPSRGISDAAFLRRAHIDIIGRLPTPDETRRFLNDKSPDKRARAVDALLERPEYADHWASMWVDLLRPNPYRVGIKAVFNYDNWIRDSFRKNKPYDQFVTELVTAQGSTWRNGAATLFRDRRSPDEVVTLVSQIFLGIRLECAKCHHHPFERWSQRDFYGLAAYFARVGRKGSGLSPPISGGEEMIMVSKSGLVRHPLTSEVLKPTPLFGKAREVTAKDDPRRVLAQWMTSKQNDYFAQVMANRIWASMMGRGLVEPVDDLRATNPPSNGPLLKALGDHFRKEKFNIKRLIRAIATSHVYQLSAIPTRRNIADTRNYSRHYRVRMRAEVLLDAFRDVTQVPDTYSAMPAGSRATQIWTRRVSSLFLDTFGRPDPNQDPPCERTDESTVTQALHLMNAPKLHAKVVNKQGRATGLAASKMTEDQIIEQLYLLTYCRMPTAAELQVCRSLYKRKGKTRRETTEDLLWAMLNTPEFIFKN